MFQNLHPTSLNIQQFYLIQFTLEYLNTNKFSSEINIYKNEYDFPSEEFSIIDSLKLINDDSYYQQLFNKQIKWSKNLYEPFKEKKFIELINNYD